MQRAIIWLHWGGKPYRSPTQFFLGFVRASAITGAVVVPIALWWTGMLTSG